MSNNSYGFFDSWLRNIKSVFHQNKKQLMEIEDEDKRNDRLTKLNIIQQVRILAKTTIIQQEWKKRPLHLHGWVYGINNGLITDLAVIHNGNEDIDPIYRFNI